MPCRRPATDPRPLDLPSRPPRRHASPLALVAGLRLPAHTTPTTSPTAVPAATGTARRLCGAAAAATRGSAL
eukprot:3016250-Prymnesium_polylepis.1